MQKEATQEYLWPEWDSIFRRFDYNYIKAAGNLLTAFLLLLLANNF